METGGVGLVPIMGGVDAQMPIECWYQPQLLRWGWVPQVPWSAIVWEPNWCSAGVIGFYDGLQQRLDDLKNVKGHDDNWSAFSHQG